MEKYENKLTLNERLQILFTRSEDDKIVLSKSIIFIMYFIHTLYVYYYIEFVAI